jgi:hypothetical protein
VGVLDTFTQAGIEGSGGELNLPFGTNPWCCGNTTWSSFSWRAKASGEKYFAPPFRKYFSRDRFLLHLVGQVASWMLGGFAMVVIL